MSSALLRGLIYTPRYHFAFENSDCDLILWGEGPFAPRVFKYSIWTQPGELFLSVYKNVFINLHTLKFCATRYQSKQGYVQMDRPDLLHLMFEEAVL